MRDGGTDGGENDGDSRFEEPKLEIPVFRNRDVDLVVDEDYWMFIVYRGDTYALPQHSVLKFVALLLVTGAVVHEISTSLETAFFWVVSLVDGIFQRIYTLCVAMNGTIASKQTERFLDNIYKILGIIILLLFLLNWLGVIDGAAIPKWVVPI